jgi:hypothetical protein
MKGIKVDNIVYVFSFWNLPRSHTVYRDNMKFVINEQRAYPFVSLS